VSCYSFLKPQQNRNRLVGFGADLMTKPFYTLEHKGRTVEVSLAADADLRRKAHDLKAALRTLESCTAALKNGYRFDDKLADEKINALARAQRFLAEETKLLLALFEAPDSLPK
jgi:hypothetical protein